MAKPTLPGSDSVNDYLAVATGFATGALAFAVGLLAAPITLTAWARGELVFAVIALALSLFLVLLVKGGIIWRITHNSGSITDLRFVALGALGILGLGAAAVLAALVTVMLRVPDTESYAVRSAPAALSAVSAQLKRKPCRNYDKLPTVELIKGLDSAGVVDSTWHVHVDLRKPTSRKTSLSCPAAYDLYVDAKSGEVLLF